MEDLGWGFALVTEGSDFESARAFGQAVSLGIAYKRAVEPFGRLRAEGLMQEDLAGGGGEEIGAPDDLRDSGKDVVDYNREFVGRDVVAVPNQKIAEVPAGEFFDGAEISIPKGNGLPVWHTKPPIQAGWGGEGFCLRRIVSPMAWENRFLGMWGEGRDFFSRTMAGVKEAGIAEAFPGFQIMATPLTLKNRLPVPIQAQPFQVLHGGGGEFGLAALGVKVLDSEKDFASGVSSAAVSGRESGGMADVQKSCRRGSDSASIAHRVEKSGKEFMKISLESFCKIAT